MDTHIIKTVLKYCVMIVAVGVAAPVAVEPEGAAAPAGRAAAPLRSVRLSSVGGANASTSGRAGGSSRRYVILPGTKTEVTMMEVNITAILIL